MKKEVITAAYQLTATTPPTCPLNMEVIGQMEMMLSGALPKSEDGSLQLNSKLEKSGAKWYLCMNENGPDFRYAQLKELEVEGNKLSRTEMNDVLDKALDKMNYRIILTGLDNSVGTKLTGAFLLTEDAKKAAVKQKAVSALDAIIKEKVDAGIITQNEIDEILAVMRENRLDEFLIASCIKKYRAHKKRPQKPSCIWIDPYIGETTGEGVISKCIRRALYGYGILLEGDKSVGKNVLAETVAWLLWKPWYGMTLNEQMTLDAYFGDRTTDNSASDRIRQYDMQLLTKKQHLEKKMELFFEAKTKRMDVEKAYAETYGNPDFFSEEEKKILKEAEEWERLKAQGATVQIITEDSALILCNDDGGVLIADEMNLGDANTNASVFNPLLDGRARMYVKGRGDVTISQDLVVIGTQNSDYEGCMTQNDAMVSRMGKIILRQPKSVKPQLKASVKANVEKDGFDWNKIKLPDDAFNQAERFYKECYKAATKDTPTLTPACLNIRGFVRALSITAESIGNSHLRENIEIEVVNPCPDDEYEALKAILTRVVTC